MEKREEQIKAEKLKLEEKRRKEENRKLWELELKRELDARKAANQ